MINLHESMGPGRDRTRDPWICSQTRICCQTRYRLRYAARSRLGGKFHPLYLPWNLPVFPGMANKAQVANNGKYNFFAANYWKIWPVKAYFFCIYNNNIFSAYIIIILLYMQKKYALTGQIQPNILTDKRNTTIAFCQVIHVQ